MTPGYVLTPRARIGLFGILDHVAHTFGERVASAVLDRLEHAFAMLAEHPGLGHTRADMTADERIRFWSVGPTLIAYRSGPDALEELAT